MKIFIILFLFMVVAHTKAQNKYSGDWHDFFGSQLKISSDYTFEFIWHFDLAASWSIGKWKNNNDTIYFETIPVYDTLRHMDSERNTKIDSLILSRNEKPGLITEKLPKVLYSGGQNIYPTPRKLFYHNNKLFYFDKEGKLLKKKIKGGMDYSKKWPSWFIKKQNT